MKWTCKKIELFIDDYLKEELSAQDKSTYEAHLQACPRCREYFDATSDFIKASHQLGKKLRAQDPGPLPQKVLEQVEKLERLGRMEGAREK